MNELKDQTVTSAFERTPLTAVVTTVGHLATSCIRAWQASPAFTLVTAYPLLVAQLVIHGTHDAVRGVVLYIWLF